jgi:hypothetical protein
MLYGGIAVEDAILSIFRDFGHLFRKLSGKKQPWEQMEIRLRLFTMAWQTIREAIIPGVYSWPVGRDMRQLKGIDEDLLLSWDGTEKDLERLEPAILERLGRIDADFRVAVVLRDILGFEDEEVMRILGIRWGVYRHRLHRGRLELKDALRAHSISSDAKGLTLQPSPTV